MSMGARGNGGHVHLLELLLVAPSATKGGSSSHITVQCCVHSKTNPDPRAALFHHMSQFVVQISVASRIVHRLGPPIPCTRQLCPQQALVLLAHDGRPLMAASTKSLSAMQPRAARSTIPCRSQPAASRRRCSFIIRHETREHEGSLQAVYCRRERCRESG